MKKYTFFILSLIGVYSFAQVAIGKTGVDGSAILDFSSSTNKGIILPWVDSSTGITSVGALIYDVSSKKVMYRDNSTWQDLSVNTGSVDTQEIDALNEKGGGIIIGDSNSAAEGVLVLNDSSKALILPKSSEPWLNVKSPEAGTLVYDTQNNLVCVYNGTEWTFWGL